MYIYFLFSENLVEFSTFVLIFIIKIKNKERRESLKFLEIYKQGPVAQLVRAHAW